MIKIKTEKQIKGMKEAGVILTKTHHALRRVIKPGITTLQLDKFAEAFMRFKGAEPAQLGYMGFPYALCTSVNEEICHGFPNNRPLQDGDILSIDNVVRYNGYLADSCWSYPVGKLSEEDQKLFDVTLECLYIGIKEAQVGARIGDIGHAIQTYAESQGFSVVRDFVGHGIGEEMHEDPQVPHYGEKGRGTRLRENMVITVEPMINQGVWQSEVLGNGWTAVTLDRKKSCQFEHTFAIRKEGPEILTSQDDSYLTDEEIKFIDSWKF